MADSHGQPGVPSGDQRPTNEGEAPQNIRDDVDIPGPYPTAQGDPTAAPANEPEPTKATRDAGALGDLVAGGGAGTLGQQQPVSPAGATRGDVGQGQSDSPREEIKKLKEESFGGAVPEEADLGTGRQKGQGLPPGSVGGDDTPQTPVT